MVNKLDRSLAINADASYFRKSLLWHALFGVVIAIPVPVKVHADTVQAENKYSANLEVEFKGGKNRSLVRPAVLLPLYQKDNLVTHFTGIALADTNNALEGNFGIGVRKMYKDNIIGAFGFYDIRKSKRGNVIHQATFGGEWFREYFEFRANLYLPQQKQFSLGSETASNVDQRGSTVEITNSSSEKFEKALRGFDLEIGGQAPFLDSLSARLAWYRFAAEKEHSYMQDRNGVRGVVGYKFDDHIQVDAEVSYDNDRKSNYFLGLKLGYNFDKNNTDYSKLTRLEKKMTSIPIRDIDAVVTEGSKRTVISNAIIENLTPETTILVANEATGELNMYDLRDGKLHTHTASMEKGDAEISSAVSKLYDTNIITDENTIVLLVDSNNMIKDINEFNSRGALPGNNQSKTTVEDRKRFANLLNAINHTNAFDLAMPGVEHTGKAIATEAITTAESTTTAEDSLATSLEYTKAEQAHQAAIEELAQTVEATLAERSSLEQELTSKSEQLGELNTALTATKEARTVLADALAQAEQNYAGLQRTLAEKVLGSSRTPAEEAEKRTKKLAIAKAKAALSEHDALQSQAQDKTDAMQSQVRGIVDAIEARTQDLEKYESTRAQYAVKTKELADERVVQSVVKARAALSPKHRSNLYKQDKVVQDKVAIEAKQAKNAAQIAEFSASKVELQANMAKEQQALEEAYSKDAQLTAVMQEAIDAKAAITSEIPKTMLGYLNPTPEQKVALANADLAIDNARKEVTAQRVVVKETTAAVSASRKKMESLAIRLDLLHEHAANYDKEIARLAGRDEHYTVKVASIADADAKQAQKDALVASKGARLVRNIDKLDGTKVAVATISQEYQEAISSGQDLQVSIAAAEQVFTTVSANVSELQSEVVALKAEVKQHQAALDSANAAPQSTGWFSKTYHPTEEEAKNIADAKAALVVKQQALAAKQSSFAAKSARLEQLKKRKQALASQEIVTQRLTAKLTADLDVAKTRLSHYEQKVSGLEVEYAQKAQATQLQAEREAAGLTPKHIAKLVEKDKLEKEAKEAASSLDAVSAELAKAAREHKLAETAHQSSATADSKAALDAAASLLAERTKKHDELAAKISASQEMQTTIVANLVAMDAEHQARQAAEAAKALALKAKQERDAKDALVKAEVQAAPLDADSKRMLLAHREVLSKMTEASLLQANLGKDKVTLEADFIQSREALSDVQQQLVAARATISAEQAMIDTLTSNIRVADSKEAKAALQQEMSSHQATLKAAKANKTKLKQEMSKTEAKVRVNGAKVTAAARQYDTTTLGVRSLEQDIDRQTVAVQKMLRETYPEATVGSEVLGITLLGTA